MANKITVTGTSGLKTENFQRIKIDKIEKICGACGNRIPPQKPYGYLYVPVGLKDLEEIVIRVRPEEGEKNE